MDIYLSNYSAIKKAAKAIKDADALIFTSGAGMSVGMQALNLGKHILIIPQYLYLFSNCNPENVKFRQWPARF